MRHVRFFLFLCVICLRASVVVASEPSAMDREAGERLYREGKLAEERLDFPAALRAYEESIARAPSGRFALAAEARASDLRAHAEGGFEPLGVLERARRGEIGPEELAARAFPDGPVRGEARMLVAEAYLDRADKPREGEAMLELVVHDPFASLTARRFAARRLVDRALARGETARALEIARAVDDEDLARRASTALRRGWLRRGSIAALALVLALAALAIRAEWSRAWRAARAELAPVALFALLLGAGGGALASSYERGNAAPFAVFGLAVFVLALVARAWGAVGSARTRALRSFLCGAAALAAGFLVLDRVNPAYLDGFGL